MTDKNIEKSWLDHMAGLDRYNRWFFGHIERYLGNYVWEAGSGIGTYSRFMLDRTQLILSDIVDEYLAALKNNFGKHGNVKILKIDLLDNSNRELISQYRIDTILSINVFEHIKADRAAIEFIYNVLKKNGIFIFIGPNHKFLYNSLDKHANHYRRYSLKETVSYLKDLGFVIEKAFAFNKLAALAWFWHGSILRRKIIPPGSVSYYNMIVPIAGAIDSI
ncbi:MAG: methyltransferase, partial [Candidatus Omnitrophota bacterium]|nr:methyltransferase [Candidatus Omnitrophota bacterium]